ncbi:hypothetical protein, partial [Micromonospora sp. NPDC003776]
MSSRRSSASSTTRPTRCPGAVGHNPADPNWAGRDRFVLSAGHSSLT